MDTNGTQCLQTRLSAIGYHARGRLAIVIVCLIVVLPGQASSRRSLAFRPVGRSRRRCRASRRRRPSAEIGGFSLIAAASGPQIAVMRPANMFSVCVQAAEEVCLTLPLSGLTRSVRIVADVQVRGDGEAEVTLTAGDQVMRQTVRGDVPCEISVDLPPSANALPLVVTTRGLRGEAAVRWQRWRCVIDDQTVSLPPNFAAGVESFPPPVLPDPRPAIERELIEWDWRMQDGILTRASHVRGRRPSSWSCSAVTS